MKITDIKSQLKNPDRLNIFVDGEYNLSLTLKQVVDLGVRVGVEFSEDSWEKIKKESIFGKIYSRSLEYCFRRVRSVKEVRDYLHKKLIFENKYSLEKAEAEQIAKLVIEKLQKNNYLDDYRFGDFWLENRKKSKGASQKMLVNELLQKGLSRELISELLLESDRNEQDDLRLIVQKKQKKYPDKNKLMQYLMRQGFGYDAIKKELDNI